MYYIFSCLFLCCLSLLRPILSPILLGLDHSLLYARGSRLKVLASSRVFVFHQELKIMDYRYCTSNSWWEIKFEAENRLLLRALLILSTGTWKTKRSIWICYLLDWLPKGLIILPSYPSHLCLSMVNNIMHTGEAARESHLCLSVSSPPSPYLVNSGSHVSVLERYSTDLSSQIYLSAPVSSLKKIGW